MDASVQVSNQFLDLRTAISIAIIETSEAASHLETWIQNPRGPMHAVLTPFIQKFSYLYRMSAPRKVMRGSNGLSTDIKQWLGSKVTSAKVAGDGLDLFDKWQIALEDAGLITVGGS